MQIRGETGTHKRDQRVGRKHQNQSHPHQQCTNGGVEGGQNMGAFLPRPAAEHADHRTVKGAVDATQQDQKKPRQHVGVVVGVIGRTHPEGCSDHQLADQTPCLAEQRAVGHHQGNALERSRHRRPRAYAINGADSRLIHQAPWRQPARPHDWHSSASVRTPH